MMIVFLSAAATSTVLAVPPEGGPKHERNKDRIMKKFDVDGDGVLSDTEKAAMKADREAMIAKYDTDKDGKLSEEERAAIPKPEKKAKPEKKQAPEQSEE